VRGTDPASAAAAARRLPAPSVVTSVPCGAEEIGLVAVSPARAVLLAHPRLEGVPRGTGDVVTGVFTAGLVGGRDGVDAAEGAARAVAETVAAAVAWGSGELPLVSLGQRLVRPTAEVRIEEIG
jgi:pyridoxine kinase